MHTYANIYQERERERERERGGGRGEIVVLFTLAEMSNELYFNFLQNISIV